MKRTNKKGFTIVELVIVIAVIAILAAVLIPNLSRLVDKANESKTLQNAEGALKTVLLYQEDGALEDGTVFKVDGKYFTYTNGKLGEAEDTATTSSLHEVTKDSDNVTVGNHTYTFDKIAELGDAVVYLNVTDIAQIDNVVEGTTAPTP